MADTNTTETTDTNTTETILPPIESFNGDSVTEGGFKTNFATLIKWLSSFGKKTSDDIDTLVNNLSKETTERTTAINNEITNRNDAIKTASNDLKTLISKEIDALFEAMYPVDSVYMSFNNVPPSKGTWKSLPAGKMLRSTISESGITGGADSVNFTLNNCTITGTALTVNQLPKHQHTLTGTDATAKASSGGSHTHGVGTYTIKGSTQIIEAHEKRLGIVNTSGAFTSSNSGVIEYPDGGADTKGTWNRTLDLNATKDSGFTGSSASGGGHEHTLSGNTASAGAGATHTHSITHTGTNVTVTNPYITVFMWRRTA